MGKVAKTAPQNKPSDYLKYESTGRPWWTCDPKGESILQQSETGYASYKAGVPLHTIPELFSLAVKKHPNEVALRSEDMPPLAANEKPPAALPLREWKSWTWKQYEADARKAAKAMISFGLQPHDACNIFGFNSPQWLIAMMGVILAGGKAAGVYPSDTAEQLQFKSDHSNGAVIVLENEECYEKVKEVANQLPMLKVVVAWAFAPQGDIKTSDGRVIKVLAWDEFLKTGAAIPDADLEGRLSKIKAGHCAALIYTSGTTGNPKAVMVSHDNIVYTAFTVLKVPNILGNKDSEERMISYLPLSHVAGMMVDIIAPIAISSNLFGFKGWCSVNFARPYDLKKGSLVDRLGAIRPTFFLGVPRVWEKIMEKLKAVGATTKGFKKMLSTFAKSKASVYTSTRQLGGKGVTPSNIGIANAILGAIKKKLGLDKCKFMFTGAAPMTQECLEYFGALGININEVYGMSECTGAVTWSTDEYHLWGTVGFEIPGAEVRIFKKEETASNVECPPAQNVFAPSEEEQGEICYRARSIMMGYMANDRLGKAHVEEVEQKNREAIDATGFLHSGDKGTRGVNGMIKITGRYKELIIGAGGENIAPVPIEDELKRLLPFVSNVMMVGNKRKFNVAVFTLKAIGATGELPGGDKLAPPASEVSASKTITEAMKDTAFSGKIREAIIAVNSNTKVVPSNAAKIQKFTILPRDFSVVTGELTATLKLKRNVVDDEFKPIIDKMYEVAEEYVPYSMAPTHNLQMGEGAPVPEEQINLDIKDEVEAAEKEFSS